MRNLPEEIFDKTEFLLSFKHKFDNVLRKVPIKALFKIVEPIVYISVMHREQDIEFTLDYLQPVKKNIFEVRKILYEETFPTIEITKSETVGLSGAEIENLINEGISVDKAINMTKEVVSSTTQYKIDKVIIDRDEIFLNDLNSDWRGHYRLEGIMISVFLKRLREQWTPKEGGSIFEKNAVFIKRIYSEQVYDQMKNTRELK